MPSNAVQAIKQAAAEAVEAGKPVTLVFGTVLSASPLQIQADQKSIYTEAMLVLTRNVTDYEVDMEVSHKTEETAGGSDEEAFESHYHKYTGTKKFKVKNALVTGDKVLLARVQQGKRFVVLDRIAAIPTLEGEWL